MYYKLGKCKKVEIDIQPIERQINKKKQSNENGKTLINSEEWKALKVWSL